MTRSAALLLGGFAFRLRVDPKFHPDVREFLGISGPVVAHHHPSVAQPVAVNDRFPALRHIAPD
jgi:hypothetical protein